MKKNYIRNLLLVVPFLMMICPVKAQLFSYGAPGNNYTLTCLNPAITMTTIAFSSSPYNYTWTVSGSTLNGNYVNITQPGTWTVVGTSY